MLLSFQSDSAVKTVPNKPFQTENRMYGHMFVSDAAGINRILSQLHKFFNENRDFELDVTKLQT